MLVGSILWVKWSEILKSFIVYSLIGAFHYWFRDKFLPISEDYKKAKQQGIKVKLWDCLFYLTLGIVVMHSVRIGGILVVFAFLIIPASISILFTQKWFSRIAIAWIGGTIVTMFGLFFSWKMDVPSGPAVILFLGIFLLFALLVKSLGLVKT
jgi:zinc/manganese transport system permease protein